MPIDPNWLEVAEKGGTALFAFIMLGAFVKGFAILAGHKKASEDARHALDRANDEARIALVNKLTDALIDVAKEKRE